MKVICNVTLICNRDELIDGGEICFDTSGRTVEQVAEAIMNC